MTELKVLTAGKIEDDSFDIFADGDVVAGAATREWFRGKTWEVHLNDGWDLNLPRKTSKEGVLEAVRDAIATEQRKLAELGEMAWDVKVALQRLSEGECEYVRFLLQGEEVTLQDKLKAQKERIAPFIRQGS